MSREVYPGMPRMSSESLPRLTARRPPKDPRGPFADLTWAQQRVAEQWFFKFCKRWGNDLPNWRRAILIGVAKRLAKKPLTPERARSIWRARCGHALANRCRIEGIPHPRIVAMHRGLAQKRAGKNSVVGQFEIYGKFNMQA